VYQGMLAEQPLKAGPTYEQRRVKLMFKQWYQKALALIIAMVALVAISATAFASFDNEPFESEDYYSYGGSKDGVFSLTYEGVGGGDCDSNDRRFSINVNYSYNGSDWNYYSSNGYYEETPSGRVPYGHSLDDWDAHVCFGAAEFSWILHPFSYWTTSGVENNVYTWRR